MFKLLKNLQIQGFEFLKNLENRFSESNAYNVLKEKYQSLNVGRQKLIKYFLIAFLFLSIFYFPVSHLFSSIVSWSSFKQKYNLSLDLLRARNKSSSFLRLSKEELKAKINKAVEKYSSNDFKIIDSGKPFPKAQSVRQVDFSVGLEDLNIKQAVKLGAELNVLPQMRLSEISFEESKEYPKHYDITYKLEAFVSKSKGKTPVIRRKPVKKKSNRSNRVNNVDLEDKAVKKKARKKREKGSP